MSAIPAKAEQLRTQILEQVHDAVVTTDIDLQILSWNAAAERLYGYSEDEVRGRAVEFLLHPDERVALNILTPLSEAQPEAVEFVGRFRHRSGVFLLVEARYAILRDANGSAIGIVICSHDVTHRVEQADELRLQSRVLDSMGEAVFLTDIDGTILYCNPAASRIFVLRQQAGLVGTPIRQLLSSPDDSESLAEWETIQLALRSHQEWSGELHFRRLNGEDCISTYSVGKVSGRGAEALVWVLQDVTHRMRAEAAMRNRERLFHIMADKAPVMVWTLDVNGAIEYVNLAWRRQWGLTVEEARSGKWWDFVTPDTLSLLESELSRAAKEQSPFEVEFRMVDAAGDERTVLSHGTPLGKGDSFGGFVGSTTDITAIRHAEESRLLLERRNESAQRLESLGVMAGGIAHDFNNLLVSILGFTELAMDDLDEDHSARSYIAQVEVAARRASELTQQILTFSGRARSRTKTINVGSLLLEMLQLLESSLAGRARLSVESSAPTPDIEGDPSQIRQVVMNLLLNAADSIVEPPGRVNVRLFPTTVSAPSPGHVPTAVAPRPGEWVCLEVEDDGCGMDEETQSKIFEPFFSTKPSGRGLGLASVLGIIRSHQGGIEVDSAPGRGATFRVYFPVGLHAPTAGFGSEAPAVAPALPVDSQRRLRILLVDDDQSVLATLDKLMKREGYFVRSSLDRAESLQIFEQDPGAFDLIVLDLNMPGMDASEAMRRFRKIRPGVPVLLASGYSVESLQEIVENGSQTLFLQKPFQVKELVAAINQLCATPGGDSLK